MANAGGELVHVGVGVRDSGRIVVLDRKLLNDSAEEVAAGIEYTKAIDGANGEELAALVLKVLLPLPLE